MKISGSVLRLVLLAVGGFMLGSFARTAGAATTQFESNYAISYDGQVVRCTGNPGTDCDNPGD